MDFVRHKWVRLKQKRMWQWRCRNCTASVFCNKADATPNAAMVVRAKIHLNCLTQRERMVQEILEI